MRIIIVIFAAGLLAGCTATAEQRAAGCSTRDVNYLAGLRAGQNINPPDPSTAKGQTRIAERQELEARCGGVR